MPALFWSAEMAAPGKILHNKGREPGTALLVWTPYIWLAAFILIPCFIVFRISLSQTAIAQPPYLPVFDISGGLSAIRDFLAALSFDNYTLLAADTLYISSYLKTLDVAAIAT